MSSSFTDFGRTYPLDTFPQGTIETLGSTSNVVISGPIPTHVDLENLAAGVTEHTKQLIRDGRPLQPRYKSRSEAVYAVVCSLTRAEVAPETIMSILVDPTYGISESIREKRDPNRYAERQVRSAASDVADGWPDITGKGKIMSTYRNTVLGIRRLGVVGEFDLFHHRKYLAGIQFQHFQGDLTDDLCASLREVFIRAHGFDPGRFHIIEATNFLCIENAFHPIHTYLVSCVWDGTRRLEEWLVRYLGADDTPLNRATGKILLVAAVRRIFEPGAKFDTIVVLEGRQGTGKSTAIRVMAGDANFSDQDILVLEAKQQMEAMEGVWLYEISELAGLNRSEIAKVKAFASRQVDDARPAYARFKERRPRQTVFIGTTNEDKYLRDTTGNRRFLPVKTTTINLAGLRRDRDQLWAEAVALERTGFSIVLPPELWADATREQEARLEDHPWFEVLENTEGEVRAGIERMSSQQLLSVLEIPPERQRAFQLKDIAAIMRKLGWEGPKKLKIDGKTRQGYERSTEKPDREFPTRREQPF